MLSRAAPGIQQATTAPAERALSSCAAGGCSPEVRTRRAAWRSRPNRLLAWATITVIGVALLLPYSGAVATLFGLVPLPWPLLAVTLAIAAAYIGLTEAAKHWFYAVALKPRAASRARRRRR